MHAVFKGKSFLRRIFRSGLKAMNAQGGLMGQVQVWNQLVQKNCGTEVSARELSTTTWFQMGIPKHIMKSVRLMVFVKIVTDMVT